MPRYRVTAPHHAITEIRDDLASGAIDGVTAISEPRPAQAGLAERRSHGQMEVWELIVLFAGGVASNAAYDALRAVFAKHPDVRQVDEVDAGSADTADADEGS